MSKKKLKVIKFGGSIITDKTSEQGVARIEKIIEIADLVNEMIKSCDLVIVLGAGSYGHPLAKKYRLKEGLIDGFQGALLTHASVENLRMLFVEKFLERGLCALGISPMTRFVEGEVEVQSIRKLIDLGIIPVLHGDVVFDSKKGVRIMSGDEIVIKTAELLKADQVIFVTNGDGLFDPENAGKTISEIDRLELIKIKEKLTHQTDGVDVTKGFLGKIEWCTGFTPVQGIRIIDGMNSENLRRGLLDNHGGTLISPA